MRPFHLICEAHNNCFKTQIILAKRLDERFALSPAAKWDYSRDALHGYELAGDGIT